MLTDFDKGLIRGACEQFIAQGYPITPWRRAIIASTYADDEDNGHVSDVLIRYCDWRIRRERGA